MLDLILFIIEELGKTGSPLQKQPPDVLYKKGVLKNSAKFAGNNCVEVSFFNKVAGFRPANSSKKRLQHRFFPVNFAKVFRTFFLQNISGLLLLTPLYME